MNCPECGASWYRIRKNGTMRCNACSHTFSPGDVKPIVEKRKTHSGSGVIAGKIQMGRGMKWGAGW